MTGADATSRERLRVTAERIAERTGLQVDVTAGSSPTPLLVDLPASRLGRPAVTSLIIGARTDEQLADNLAAAELTLDAQERARLDEVSAPTLLYPYWHQAKTARDRLSPAGTK